MQARVPLTVARPQGRRVHTAPDLEPRPTSGWHVFCFNFMLLSHLQTQEATLSKGRWRLPGGKAGLLGPVQPGRLGLFAGKLSRTLRDLAVGRHLKW